MELSTIIGIVTAIVTFILGILAKEYDYLESKMIPLQNLLIGIIASIIYYIITKDINITLAGVGLFTGGTYDLVKNIKELFYVDDNDYDDSDNEDE